jgi:hypothetical protein
MHSWNTDRTPKYIHCLYVLWVKKLLVHSFQASFKFQVSRFVQQRSFLLCRKERTQSGETLAKHQGHGAPLRVTRSGALGGGEVNVHVQQNVMLAGTRRNCKPTLWDSCNGVELYRHTKHQHKLCPERRLKFRIQERNIKFEGVSGQCIQCDNVNALDHCRVSWKEQWTVGGTKRKNDEDFFN